MSDYSRCSTQGLRCSQPIIPPVLNTCLLASGQLRILFHEAEVCLTRVAALLQPLLSEICTIDAATTGGAVKVGLYDLRLVPELEKHVYKSSSEAGLNVKAVEVVADPSAHLRVVVPPESVLREYKAESEQILLARLRSASQYYGDVRTVSKSLPSHVEEDGPLSVHQQPLLLRHRSEGSVLSAVASYSPPRYTVEFYDMRSAARMRKALNHHSPITPTSTCLPDTYSWALALYSRYGFRTVEPGDLEGVGNFGQRRRSPSYEDGRGHLEIDLHKVELGLDNRTAVMIRNVPRNYTQPMLFAELVEAIHIAGYDVYMIDYVYMPYDVRQKESSTYVFVNVKEAVMIEPLYGIFEGQLHMRILPTSHTQVDGGCAALPRSSVQRGYRTIPPMDVSGPILYLERYARCHGLSAILNSLSRGAAQQLPACYRPLVAVTLPLSSPQLEDTGSLPPMAGDDGAAPPSCPIVERSKSVREPPPALQLKPTPDSTEIVPQSPTAFLPKNNGVFPTPKVLLEPGSILVAPSSDEDVVSHDGTDRSSSQEEEACRADGQASTHAEEQCLSTAMMMVDHCLGVE